MSQRKTVDVEYLRSTVNQMCRVSTCPPDRRQGMMNLLEAVLHKTGNYRGYRYLLQIEVPKGERPGVNYGPHGEPLPIEERFVDTDSTRVQYH